MAELNAAQQRALALARARARAQAQMQTHPEFDPTNVPGGLPNYNRETGMMERPAPGILDSLAIGAADTATLGFSDELAGGVASLMGGDGDRVKANMRELQGASAEENPWTHLGGQVGGGALLAAATRGASFLPNATSLGGRVLGGMLTGGAYGGAYGAGSGEDLGGRTIESAKGAGAGALVGGALPVVSTGASKVYEQIRNMLAAGPIAKGAGTNPGSLRAIRDVIDGDGALGPTGQANMALAGQDAMLADAGPTARRMLDTAIQRTGPGATVAREAIDARVARGGQALTQSLDDMLGAPQGVTATRTGIRNSTASARSTAYDDAYKMAIDYSDPRGQAIEKMVKKRVPKSAIDAANTLMRAEGAESRQILAKIADDGSVVFETLPDVRQLDYITRGLNEVADAANNQGVLGGTTATGRAFGNLSREIRDNLKDLVPEYGKALETAADPIRRSKAVELGSKLFSPSMTRDQAAEALQGMTGPERKALAQGIRSQIDDAMANVTRTVTDDDTAAREAIKGIRTLSSRANREKLALAIGDADANKLLSEVERIATSFDLRASVTGNSATYARQNMDARVKDMTGAGGAMDALLSGRPVNAAQRITQMITGRTPEAMRGKEDAVYAEIARLLTQGYGQSQKALQAAQLLGQTDRSTQAVKAQIARLLAGPHLSYPSTVLSTEGMRNR